MSCPNYLEHSSAPCPAEQQDQQQHQPQQSQLAGFSWTARSPKVQKGLTATFLFLPLKIVVWSDFRCVSAPGRFPIRKSRKAVEAVSLGMLFIGGRGEESSLCTSSGALVFPSMNGSSFRDCHGWPSSLEPTNNRGNVVIACFLHISSLSPK